MLKSTSVSIGAGYGGCLSWFFIISLVRSATRLLIKYLENKTHELFVADADGPVFLLDGALLRVASVPDWHPTVVRVLEQDTKDAV